MSVKLKQILKTLPAFFLIAAVIISLTGQAPDVGKAKQQYYHRKIDTIGHDVDSIKQMLRQLKRKLRKGRIDSSNAHYYITQ